MNNFREELMKVLQANLGESFEVSETETVKKNETKLGGITIKEKDSNIAPIFYLEGYHDDYVKGILTLEDISDRIIGAMDEKKDVAAVADKVRHYEEIKDMLYPTMINFEANANALAERPYVRMLDLAKVAMIRFEDLEGGSAAIQVTNSILQYWNIDEETLFEQCHKNAAKNYPPVVTNICNMLHEMAEEKQIDDADLFLDLMDEDSPMQMYVITNWRKNFGAEAICNLPLLHQLSMKKDADLFIFPSSVHELIFMYDNAEGGCGFTSEGIKEINETQVLTHERLSNSIYKYDRQRRQVVIYEQGDSLIGMKDVA